MAGPNESLLFAKREAWVSGVLFLADAVVVACGGWALIGPGVDREDRWLGWPILAVAVAFLFAVFWYEGVRRGRVAYCSKDLP